MKRRDFLKGSALIGASGIMLRGTYVSSANPIGDLIASIVPEEERILVLIQLNGGNDGLNTLIPLDSYQHLSVLRKNLILPENKVIKLNSDTGLHSSLNGFKQLWDSQRLGIIQNVGYDNPNFSHFRSTDIWTSASDSNKVINSGWLGRYLENYYPDFPTNYPNETNPHPLSISLGNVLSNTCQGTIHSMGLALSSNPNFYTLQEDNSLDSSNSYAQNQAIFIRNVILQTNKYGEKLKETFETGLNYSEKYEQDNKLADQMKTVARLINGGLKTRVYVCNIGGFDTHAGQVTDTDSTIGTHATLLDMLGNAIEAFYDDLDKSKNSEKVVCMTFSEFGRRILQNGSMGTDHGTSAPLFVFGNNVNPVIHGKNPILDSQMTVSDNLPVDVHFRSVYASVLKDWMGASEVEVSKVLTGNYEYLPIFKDIQSSNLNTNWDTKSSAYFSANDEHIIVNLNGEYYFKQLQLFDINGRMVYNDDNASAIYNTYRIATSKFSNGAYNLILKTESSIQTLKVQIVR